MRVFQKKFSLFFFKMLTWQKLQRILAHQVLCSRESAFDDANTRGVLNCFMACIYLASMR